jgi:hypothetical protein
MLTGIDHVLIACSDPDTAAAELEATVGLHIDVGGRHPSHGTFNRIGWLGDSYVELMGVFDRDLAARSWWGSHLLRVLEHSAAGWMGVALGSDDATADAALLAGRGSALGQLEAGERSRPDGGVVRWRLLHASKPDPDLGLLFLIEHDPSSPEWSPADRAQRASLAHPLGGPARLQRIEMPATDLRAAAMRLIRDVGLGFRPSLSGRGARDASVGRQTVRLMPATRGVVPRIVIRGGAHSREVSVLGCSWQLEPG